MFFHSLVGYSIIDEIISLSIFTEQFSKWKIIGKILKWKRKFSVTTNDFSSIKLLSKKKYVNIFKRYQCECEVRQVRRRHKHIVQIP